MKYLYVTLISLLLYSCSDPFIEKTITLKNTKINGKDSIYLRVLDGPCKMRVSQGTVHITVPIEIAKKYPKKLMFPFPLQFEPLNKTDEPLLFDFGSFMPHDTLPMNDQLLAFFGSDKGTRMNIDLEWYGRRDEANLAQLMYETENFQVVNFESMDDPLLHVNKDSLIYNDSTILDKKKFLSLFESRINTLDSIVKATGTIDILSGQTGDIMVFESLAAQCRDQFEPEERMQLAALLIRCMEVLKKAKN